MYDLIAIGDVTVDIVFKSDEITPKKGRFDLAVGGKYGSDFFYEGVGGGGANVAIGASNNGLNTGVLAKIGRNSFKQIILQKLLKKMVSTEFLIEDSDFINISSILLAPSGEKTVIHYASPNETLSISDAMMIHLLKGHAFYMGNLPDISLAQKISLITKLKKHDKRIYINFGKVDVEKKISDLKPLLDAADVLIMNKYEYALLIKSDVKKVDLKKNCATKIAFDEKILVITDGPDGSYAYDQGEICHQSAFKASIKDTTGAGDAFSAAFIAAHLKEQSVQESLRLASMYASKVIEKVGAN